jgi:hypothetical protein
MTIFFYYRDVVVAKVEKIGFIAAAFFERFY